MTKREHIAHYLCATALDMQHAETRTALRGIAKTLINISNELERLALRADDDGGSLVPKPVPAPVMPPQGQADPLAAISAMLTRT